MEQDRLVKRTLIALTKGGTVYPEGSLFMDVENKSFIQLKRLVKQKSTWVGTSRWPHPLIINNCAVTLNLVGALLNCRIILM